MGQYRIAAIQYLADRGIQTTINGPGISAAGVPYWFSSQEEAETFVGNLNLSYTEGKRLAECRKSNRRQHSRPLATSGMGA